jgi:hypothetical protein
VAVTKASSNSRQDVDDHPTDEHKFSFEDKDDGLKTVDGSDHCNGDDGYRRFSDRDNDNQVDELEPSIFKVNSGSSGDAVGKNSRRQR